ncbi:hypothetical protein LTQ03_20755 [Vibrio splendidus]|uniref:hypothetical protein n=1 Tax=Vibrio splendidus TaxID=29497 RepID=UPI001FB42DE0|nr:hypothetical protein [Vibrio splendidus]UOE81543.1 hypothetical protein LTQ03_20755 [Vibrio splendidus]
MSISTGFDWGNGIALGAAFVSIIALICQSRDTKKQLELQTQQLKLQNYMEYTKRYQEIILNFPESVNESSFKLSDLDQEVRDKTMRYMRVYFDLCFEEYDLQTRNMIDKDMWLVWEGGMKFAFSKPAFIQGWDIIKLDTEYNEGFNALVEYCR